MKRAIQIAPGFAKAFAVQAEVSMLSHQSAEALTAADRAVQLDPQLPYAQFVRASVLNSLTRFKEAQMAAQQGLRMDTNSWQGHFELAQALGGLNKIPEALREVTETEARAPRQFLPVHMLRAYLLVRSQMVDEARKEIALLKLKAANDPRVVRLGDMLSGLTKEPGRQFATAVTSR